MLYPGDFWTINGERYPDTDPVVATPGERIRLRLINESAEDHPMHLHGHTFQIGAKGARKDTVIVVPKQEVVCDFDADNPGQWMMHCHNTYHLESGMATVVSYVR